MLSPLNGAKNYRRLADLLRSNETSVVTHGLRAGAASLVFARLALDMPDRPILFLTSTNDAADALMDDFVFFGLPEVLEYPRWDSLPFEEEEPIVEVAAEQLDSLAALAHLKEGKSGPLRVVAPVEALLRRVLPLEEFLRMSIRFGWGERVNTNDLPERLIALGYERVSMIEGRAEFSIRGGIIDIYPINADYPVRIDLFGDEIESIRFFDVATQRSIKEDAEVEQIEIHPARLSWLYTQQALQGTQLSPFLSLFPPETLLVIHEPEGFESRLERFENMVARQHHVALEEQAQSETPHDIPSPQKMFLPRAEAESALRNFQRVINTNLPVPEEEAHRSVLFHTSSFETVEANLETHLRLIATRQAEGFAIHIVCDNDGQVERLDEVLRERGLSAQPLVGQQTASYRQRDVIEGYSDIILVTGTLHSGFSFPEIELSIVTDREIFGRYKRRRVYRKTYQGAPVISASDIQRGDYVVHAEHGIGQFQGIRAQTIEGKTTELLEISYRDGNKLLVPIDKIRDVQKYSSVDGAVPVLDRLGGKQWKARKSKTQELIEQMAQELIQIYAKRELAQGFSFGDDTVWQREFEASFIYTETPDQMNAIEQVKTDMAAPKPMDRLLCGDVGYGKTEVAIRAVFKAVQEKRQAAVLAPTTLLVQQHYNTFRERFADYPVTVEMISRFRSAAEQKVIMEKLRRGEIDVLVGTHRLLSEDIKFLDLGLLVVDEEQRFGVKQKERIKAMRASVDILTMTATPIPRTLYFALSGLRDMSVINTPPPDRQPVRTRLIHFNRDQIEEAILRELNRGGQVYFIHNRVHNIQEVAHRLKEIVPEARIAIGHGQMNEHELEKVMIDFVEGRYDILLSTTIIENGIDIPNVNTIIINRADTFGLAQLYQLRGRVGRSQRRAYAYLVVPQGAPISETAVRRLAAIQEFTDLGSGFQIAMRDLEIRGTGDLLGPRQHGAIQTVGFELYCQMLEETVSRLRGEVAEADFPVDIHWKSQAFLPSDYVPIETHRIALYKRLAAARSDREIDDIRDELRDRYGNVPRPAMNLCRLAAMRVAARPAEIEKIVESPVGLKLYTPSSPAELVTDLYALKDANAPIKAVRVEGDGAIHVALMATQKNKLEISLRVLKELAQRVRLAA